MKEYEVNEKSDDIYEMRSRCSKPLEVALEDLLGYAFLVFFENLAELGCPKEKEVDMWYRELSYDEVISLMGKFLEIEKRDRERFSVENNKKEDME